MNIGDKIQWKYINGTKSGVIVAIYLEKFALVRTDKGGYVLVSESSIKK